MRRGKAKNQTDLFPMDRAPRNAGMIHFPRPSSVFISYCPYFTSLNGYLTASSFLKNIFFRFFDVWCSTNTSFEYFAKNCLTNLGSHSSLAIPRSLQHRRKAVDLQPSTAVGIASGEK